MLGACRIFLLSLALFLACIYAQDLRSYQMKVQILYRAYCPSCVWFVQEPLVKLMNDPQFAPFIDLELVPAAGTMVEKGELDCEEGVEECDGHRYQICVIEKYKHDVMKQLELIGCIESEASGPYHEWAAKLKYCLTPEDIAYVEECYPSRSIWLMVDAVHRTGADKVGWMPYIRIDGAQLGDENSGIGLKEVKTGICKAYAGSPEGYPDICADLVGAQTHFPSKKETPPTAPPLAKPEEPQTSPPAPTGREKVKLDVFYRAFCPGCGAFIIKALSTLMRDPEFRDIIDLTAAPAAGMYVDTSGNPACLSGKRECNGHKWLACVGEHTKSPLEHVQGLACIESKDRRGTTWRQRVDYCLDPSVASSVKECEATKGDEMLRQTLSKLGSVHVKWSPYVLINDEIVGTAREGIKAAVLQQAVCNAYDGPEDKRPSACTPKRLREETEEEEEVVKPCPPKKPKTNATEDAFEDAPGIGPRPLVSSDTGAAHAAVANDGGTGGQDRVPEYTSSSSIWGPALFILIIAVGALGLSMRNTKDTKRSE